MAAQEAVAGLAEVRVEREMECRMRDGTVLRADVLATDGAVRAHLTRSPV
jgi:hypothetical protein